MVSVPFYRHEMGQPGLCPTRPHVPVIVPVKATAGNLRPPVAALLGQSYAGLAEPISLLLDRFATPVWLALHAFIVAAAGFGREIRWSGVRYRVDGPQDVVVSSRDQ